MATPLVSIIVPCHLGTPAQADLLEETLRTVDAQTVDDYELLVIDDGSPVAAEPIVSGHRNARTIPRANAGPALARNTGIGASVGRFLVFLDADDHLLPLALEVGLRGLTAHPDCGFAVGAREEMTFEGDPVPWTVAPPPAGIGRIYLPLLGFEWYIIPPSSAMFRRAVVDLVGGFQNPWGADDLDFYLRVAHRVDAWCHDAPAVTRYRRYSASSSRDGERMLDSVRAVYERQRPLIAGDAAGEAAWTSGLAQLTAIFCDCLVENVEDRLRRGDVDGAQRAARRLADESPAQWQALRARLAGTSFAVEFPSCASAGSPPSP